MGNNKSKTKKQQGKVEKYLTMAYKNTDLEFTYKEMLSFKLRIQDAENYFHSKFDYFLYFNNYLFRERISTLYENFNSKIEKFSAEKQKETFSVLIDFDEDTENIENGNKIDFESLFMIIFEKLEINIIIFFDMTNIDVSFITDFFSQLIECVGLYKYNKKFDCFYFLLPNTDYLIKNDCAVLYVTNEKIHNKKGFFNQEVNDIKNEYTNIFFSKHERNKLLNSIYPETEANNFIEYFFEQNKSTFIKVLMNFNFLTEAESFILNNEYQFKLLELLIHSCPINVIVLDDIIINNIKVLEVLIKKIINLLETSYIEENVLILKFYINKKTKNNNCEIDLIHLRKIIKNLVYDFNSYELFSNKRKFILELYEYVPVQSNNSNNSLPLVTNESANSSNLSTHNNNNFEVNLKYEKLFFYWYLGNNKVSIDIKLCFGILLRMKKLEKLKNKKIIQNIKELLFSNFLNNFSQEYKTVMNDDLFNF